MAMAPNVKYEFLPKWSIKKIYLCPRGIFLHRGDPDSCGWRCIEIRDRDGVEWEDEIVLNGVVVKRETRIDNELWTEGK